MIFRAKAPLRLSFAGGGTDVPPFVNWEGGCVLNATIDKYAHGTLRPINDGQIHVQSVDMSVSATYEVGENLVYDGKLDLVKAAIRKFCGQDSQGFDLLLQSDVPPGSGLGSSSTLMVVLVGLLRDFKNLPMTDYEIAHTAYVLERLDLGIRGGLQDQYAAAFGGFNFIEFNGDNVVVNPLRISQDIVNELEHNLLLCYTGSTRLSDRIIEDQTSRYINKEEHVVEGLRKQKELAVAMKSALLRRRLREFGALLHEAWEFKKRLSPKITTPVIDEMYEEARRQGAVGGKISGAGGGGYMLFYTPFERKHGVAAALKRIGAVPVPFAFELRGLQSWRVENEDIDD